MNTTRVLFNLPDEKLGPFLRAVEPIAKAFGVHSDNTPLVSAPHTKNKPETKPRRKVKAKKKSGRAAPGKLEAVIIHVLEASKNHEAHRDQFAKAIVAAGGSKGSLNSVVTRMAQIGAIERVSRGTYRLKVAP